MVFIYVLQLEKSKYYIGKTNNPEFRLKDHFNSNGSEWTKLYKPIKVLEIISDCDNYDEDKITKKYMDKYGISNVRGGSFVSIKLDKNIISTLKLMNKSTFNKCFICGKTDHYAKDCDDEDSYEEIFKSFLSILNNFGFIDDELDLIFELLLSILHLYNLNFEIDKNSQKIFNYYLK
jgi:predicted GIY-YIG superfamily endonuclease